MNVINTEYYESHNVTSFVLLNMWIKMIFALFNTSIHETNYRCWDLILIDKSYSQGSLMNV